MSTETLTHLGNYLLETLSKDDTNWLINFLQENSLPEPLHRYTMDEINAMLDEAERQAEAGEYVTNEELFREWNLEIEREERYEKERQKKFEMAEAV